MFHPSESRGSILSGLLVRSQRSSTPTFVEGCVVKSENYLFFQAGISNSFRINNSFTPTTLNFLRRSLILTSTKLLALVSSACDQTPRY